MSASVFNMMQAMYRAAGFAVTVNLVLVGQVTWTGPDPFTPSMIGSEAVLMSTSTTSGLLDLFNSWQTRAVLLNLESISISCLSDHSVFYVQGVVAHDASLLFSGYDFQGQVVGLAYVGTMCWSAYSGAIVQATSSSSTPLSCSRIQSALQSSLVFTNASFKDDDLFVFDHSRHPGPVVAAIASHELGHVFSALHDSVGNSCPSSGYIMNAVLTSPPSTWSTCSVSTISNFLTGPQAFCLANGRCLCCTNFLSNWHTILAFDMGT